MSRPALALTYLAAFVICAVALSGLAMLLANLAKRLL
jgi:hypothetical protein